MLVYGIDVTGKIQVVHVDQLRRMVVLLSGLTDLEIPLHVDGDGNLYVIAPENTYLNPTGVISEYQNLNLPAGTSTQTIYTVSSSQRVRLTGLSIRYVGTVTGVALIPYVSSGGNAYVIDNKTGITSGTYYNYVLDITLEAGATIKCNITGATLNNDFNGAVALQRIK